MELAIVIPVYNEEKTIEILIRDLFDLTIRENIPTQFIIINDGSTDSSLSVLESLATKIPNVNILSHKNAGHGPSLLKAYSLSLDQEWVFQMDSDYEYTLSAFNVLWNNRHKSDILIAEREERNASFLRDVATSVSQYMVALLYGSRIKDINSPYRLMRTKKLGLALPTIHSDCFAPNVLITAFFLKNKFKTFSTTAHLNPKPYSRSSSMSVYMLKGCLKTFADLLFFRFKI